MAFTVQDDDGSIDNANSLVTVEEFQEYFTDRGVDYTIEEDTPEAGIKAALIRATDYLNSKYEWQGVKKNSLQGTCQPRYDLTDLDGNLVSGIPVPVKMDCYELAAYLIDNSLTTLYSNVTAAEANIKIKRTKADVLEKMIEYFSGVNYNTLVVGNAQNSVRSGYLTFKPGMYI